MTEYSRNAACALALFTCAACGGATASGLAVGKMGSGLGAHAQQAPQGAQLCAVRKGLDAKPAMLGKPAGEECDDAVKRDRLWGGAMRVLAAYSDTLDALASGNADEMTAKINAARTGVEGNDWVDADDTKAKEAVAKLVDVMRGDAAKEDLAKAIDAAAPHVKTICSGLDGYLSEQAKEAGQVLADVEQKRGKPEDRRCGQLDSRSVCVNESATDRVVYGHIYGALAVLESNHVASRDAVAAFCAAHAELASAAADGKLDDDETQEAIVDAVKSAHGARPGAATRATEEEPAENK